MKVFIMAGGSGTRLAPLSLTMPGQLPKQFLSLIGERTLLQQAVDRIPAGNQVVIIPEEKYRLEVQRQLAECVEILAEPFGCNTAAAIALAIKDLADDQVVLFLPADHLMSANVFGDIFAKLEQKAKVTDKVITIGITPERPETGYGYIRVKQQAGEFLAVERFVEKPDLPTAQSYLQQGNYYWNAGMFCFQAGVMKKALQCHAKQLWQLLTENDLTSAYTQIKATGQNISIDYAVMEKIAPEILLYPAPLELEWNDVGGWPALQKYLSADNYGNYLYGQISIRNCQNCQLMNYDQTREVSVEGLQKALVVNTAKALLITLLDQASQVKLLIPALEAGQKFLLHAVKHVRLEQGEDHFTAVIGYDDLLISHQDKVSKILAR